MEKQDAQLAKMSNNIQKNIKTEVQFQVCDYHVYNYTTIFHEFVTGEVHSSLYKLLSFSATKHNQILKKAITKKLLLYNYFIQNVHYQEKVYATSNKLLSSFAANYHHKR